ncbi:ABC transporter permease [Roseisalinus antarcticus]|uniref:Putative aliphatic sulfonates transport permease protein SsuC n=1 Tax=Roseisalinus antarcticus TaxID=254357 RepID=A0A1Y5SK36_9RHOB|nr:ABC transporter permease [Roseisalinus antarcticus]SLN42279.1 Putative aliphatic sulfonates transport permease protein SsuC [Roseisalinus antarcticus]
MADTAPHQADKRPSRYAESQERLAALGRFARFVAVVLVVVVVLWQGAISLLDIEPFVAPDPLSVGQALVQETDALAVALAYTLRSTVGGVALALVLAVSIAGLFTLSPLLSRALLPLIIMLRTAPILAIAPLLILIFGRGQTTSIVVVVIVSFFPIMVNAARGFASPKANALELMHVCGASWWQTFTRVRVPFALPFIFTGIRMASAGAVLSAMLAEWLSGAPGIGTLILEASSFRKLPLMWAGVVVSMITATAIYGLTVWMERRLSR